MPEEDAPEKLCFVVGPIGADDSPERIHADWLLEMIVQPVMAGFPEFETQRADQIAAPGMIDAQVIDALLKADLVIADLSTLNPNAFYEIGIRHMAQKPIIHMQIAEEKIPFDVSLYRAIKYSRQRPADLRAAQAALRAQVKAVLVDGYQVENPVTRTRGIVQIEQHATPETQLLHGQMKIMQEQIGQLQIALNAVQGSTAISGNTIAYPPTVKTGPERGTILKISLDPAVSNASLNIEECLKEQNIAYGYSKSPEQMILRLKTSGLGALEVVHRVQMIEGVKGIITSPS